MVLHLFVAPKGQSGVSQASQEDVERELYLTLALLW
jgi:hypothetical protein